MKKALKNVIAALLVAAPMSMAVASSGGHYEHAEIDPRDQVSLQRGAQIFVNNCLSCHSAAAMRYNRLQDIGLSEDEIKKNLMFTTDKVGDVMQAHMSPADSKKWFGKTPPDLTLIAVLVVRIISMLTCVVSIKTQPRQLAGTTPCCQKQPCHTFCGSKKV